MRTGNRTEWGWIVTVLLSVALLHVSSERSAAQRAAGLPFRAGERLEYRVRTEHLGGKGSAVMRVDPHAPIRGRPVLQLHFETRLRVAVVSAESRSRSWLDPERVSTMRYHMDERSPLATVSERVEVFPEERRWTGADGRSGVVSTATPLDELSFLYYLRTLPLEDGVSLTLHHHYDGAKNPVRVRVIGRGPMRVPAGDFRAIEVEMRVPETSRVGGRGLIRIHFSDDAQRIPIRYEARTPMVGTTVLELESSLSS